MTALTVLIVGATSGVGRATGDALTAAGHRVLGVGRDPGRVREIQAAWGPPGNAVAVDVATRSGWDAVARWALDQTDRLDVLINAAGVMQPSRQITSDGVELNFAVHHLAPFAITGRLLPLLHLGAVGDGPGGSALPRVINVNSAGHQTSLAGHVNPTLDFDDLQAERAYDPFLAYSRSKLANLLFTYELVRRHGTELAVSALHPGVVRTNIGRHFPRIRVAAAQAFAISASRSARSVVGLATGPLPRNGQYFDRSAPTASSGPSYDTVAASRLWSITEQLCGEFDSTIRQRHPVR